MLLLPLPNFFIHVFLPLPILHLSSVLHEFLFVFHSFFHHFFFFSFSFSFSVSCLGHCECTNQLCIVLNVINTITAVDKFNSSKVLFLFNKWAKQPTAKIKKFRIICAMPHKTSIIAVRSIECVEQRTMLTNWCVLVQLKLREEKRSASTSTSAHSNKLLYSNPILVCILVDCFIKMLISLFLPFFC